MPDFYRQRNNSWVPVSYMPKRSFHTVSSLCWPRLLRCLPLAVFFLGVIDPFLEVLELLVIVLEELYIRQYWLSP
jgi:hypothetical protein